MEFHRFQKACWREHQQVLGYVFLGLVLGASFSSLVSIDSYVPNVELDCFQRLVRVGVHLPLLAALDILNWQETYFAGIASCTTLHNPHVKDFGGHSNLILHKY